MVWSPMSDWREQNQLSQRLFEHTQQALESVIIRGCEDWPLPEPPLSDPDFPVHPPENPEKLKQIAHALFQANRAAFDRGFRVHRRSTDSTPFVTDCRPCS
ncbi:MAG: hypothetical protein Ct9H90mP16_15410 [Candidatus Poseidoniales archaeon]|nr:MAG: hypothetical protein Ct9H90mP16_15410 [Candidatus Poseidoniales archaeon]